MVLVGGPITLVAPMNSFMGSPWRQVATGWPQWAIPATAVDGDEDATLLVLPLAGGGEVARVVPLSVGADDRFWSVVFDAQDRIYAAGFATVNGDSRMVVARFNTAGTLDASFGNGGIATLNVLAAGTAETVRGIVLQTDGKIVIAGTVEAADTE